MIKITLVVILPFLFILIACTDVPSTPKPEPTEVITVIAEVVATDTAVSSTNTPRPSPMVAPTQTLQPTITSTPIPTPTVSIRVLAETAVPQPNQPISPENVTQLTELARWGRGVINDIDLSGNGRWIAVGTATGVYIHDAQDLSHTVFHLETPIAVGAVAISPDGNLLAINQAGELIQVWNVQANQLIFEKELLTFDIGFSPNGEYIIVNSGGTHILSAQDGEIIQIYPDTIWARFSPNHSELAVWSYNPLSIYSWPENKLINEIKPLKFLVEDGYEFSSAIGNMQFLPDGEVLMSALPVNPIYSTTGDILIQKGENGELHFDVGAINLIAEPINTVCNEPVYYADPPASPQPWQMELSSDGQIVAFVFRDVRRSDNEYTNTSVRFYDQQTGQNLFNVEEGIEDIAMSPNSNTWVAGLQNGRLQVRSLTDGSILDSVAAYDAPALKTVVSPDSELVAVEYLDEVKIYRMATGEELYQYPARHIAFAPDNETFAMGYADGRLEIRNLADDHLRKTIFAHDDSVTAVTYLPTGELVSTGLDCGFHAWNPENGALSQTFENYLVDGRAEQPNPARILDLSASQNSPFLIGQFYGEIGVWNIESGALLNVPELENYANSATIHENQLAVSGSPLWLGNLDAAGRFSTSWEGFSTSAVTFSFDGNLLASGSDSRFSDHQYDGALRLFLVDSSKLLHELTPMTDRVTGLAFAENGRYFVSSTIDGVVRIWGVP